MKTVVTDWLRPARLTAVAAVVAAGLTAAAAPALAATPNQSQTVTCGTGCFNVASSATTTGNGSATFSSSDRTLSYSFTISGESSQQDMTLALAFGGGTSKPKITCTDSSGSPGKTHVSPITLSQASFPVTCTATYKTAASDLTAGYVNTTFGITSDTDSATTNGVYSVYEDGHVPAVSVHQSDTIAGPSSGNAYAAAGESIDYTATVTNSGQVPLSDPSVAASNPSISYACPSGQPIAPGASVDCTGSYTVTQDDVDRGPVSNSATATATPTSSGTPVLSGADSLVLNPAQQPAASLLQLSQASGFDAASRPITYDEHVANTGNVTLFFPSVSNTLAGVLPLSCPQSVLSPGASETCSQTYITSSGDVAARSVANTATFTFATPDDTVSSNPSTSTVGFNGAVPPPPGVVTPAPTPPTAHHKVPKKHTVAKHHKKKTKKKHHKKTSKKHPTKKHHKKTTAKKHPTKKHPTKKHPTRKHRPSHKRS